MSAVKILMDSIYKRFRGNNAPRWNLKNLALLLSKSLKQQLYYWQIMSPLWIGFVYDGSVSFCLSAQCNCQQLVQCCFNILSTSHAYDNHFLSDNAVGRRWFDIIMLLVLSYCLMLFIPMALLFWTSFSVRLLLYCSLSRLNSLPRFYSVVWFNRCWIYRDELVQYFKINQCMLIKKTVHLMPRLVFI